MHRLTARLRALRRFGLDVCLGRMDPADGSQPVYVGRLGLSGDGGSRPLLDWLAPHTGGIACVIGDRTFPGDLPCPLAT